SKGDALNGELERIQWSESRCRKSFVSNLPSGSTAHHDVLSSGIKETSSFPFGTSQILMVPSTPAVSNRLSSAVKQPSDMKPPCPRSWTAAFVPFCKFVTDAVDCSALQMVLLSLLIASTLEL